MRLRPAARERIRGGSAEEDAELRLEVAYLDRILDAYSDMRWSTRSLIRSNPSESRLLFLALLSDVVFFLARSLTMVVAPPDSVGAQLPEQIGLGLVLAFLVRTSLFYLIAATAKILSAPFGGRGSWRETRAAVFWAAFVSAPVEAFGALLLLAGGGLASIIPLPPAPSVLVETPYLLGPIAFGFFVCAGVAEAQGFRYTYRVMIAAALIALPLLWGALVLLQA